jgi:hypothetical protein
MTAIFRDKCICIKLAGGFQPDAGAAADDDDGLAEQFPVRTGWIQQWLRWS